MIQRWTTCFGFFLFISNSRKVDVFKLFYYLFFSPSLPLWVFCNVWVRASPVANSTWTWICILQSAPHISSAPLGGGKLPTWPSYGTVWGNLAGEKNACQLFFGWCCQRKTSGGPGVRCPCTHTRNVEHGTLVVVFHIRKQQAASVHHLKTSC